MIRDELLFDKIEAYLRGKLPPADAAAFEAEIDADAELAALVKTQRLERQGLEWLVERDLLTKMNAWEREANSAGTSSGDRAPSRATAPVRVTFVRRWWAAGLAAALMIGVFGWWLLQPQDDIGGPSAVVTAPKAGQPAATPPAKLPKPAQKPPVSRPKEAEDRVAETPRPAPSDKPAPTIPTTKPPAPAAVDYAALASAYYRKGDFMQERDGTSGGNTPGYGQALDSYKSGKYTDVEKLLKPTLKSDPNALKNKELLAHSLYQRGQYTEALSYFRQLSGAKDKALAERSEWAMALTLLHLLPAQKALLTRTLDRIIAKPGHAFYEKAKELKGRTGD